MTSGSQNQRKKQNMSWVVIALVLILLLFGTQWVAYFVRNTAVEAAAAAQTTLPNYVNFNADGSYVSGESNTAIAQYLKDFPEPQNAQVLVGMTTSEIYGFMLSYVAGGLHVDCTYCHSLANFAADGAEIGDDVVAARKATAREQLTMVAELNQNWLTQLAAVQDKQPSGAQIICATCHYGEAIPVAWPADLYGIPDNYRLPLADYVAPVDPNSRDRTVQVTGKGADLDGDGVSDASLDAVQFNQNTMFHFTSSLGVGCTHCHNSRYFPSWEQPAKYYAFTMLQMSQHILTTYPDAMNNQEPSCFMCHRNQVRPPGAAASAADIPALLSTEYVPGQ